MTVSTTIQFNSISTDYKTFDFVRPFQTSHGLITQKKALVLELSSESHTVYSECVALEDPGYHPETIILAEEAIQDLIPTLCGKKWSIHTLANDLQKLRPKNCFAIAAIEMGAWALLAADEGLRLDTMLGIKKRNVGSGIVISIPKSKELFIEDLDAALQKKYQKIKCKLSPESLPRIIEWLHAYPQLAKIPYLSFDANERFRIEDMSALLELATLPVRFLEQPFPRDDWSSHTTLQAAANFSICLDESIQKMEDLKTLTQTKAAKMVMIKPGKHAGFFPTLEMLKFCQDSQIDCCLGGMFETGIGRYYNLALASHPAFTVPPDLSEQQRYFEDDIVPLSIQKV